MSETEDGEFIYCDAPTASDIGHGGGGGDIAAAKDCVAGRGGTRDRVVGTEGVGGGGGGEGGFGEGLGGGGLEEVRED